MDILQRPVAGGRTVRIATSGLRNVKRRTWLALAATLTILALVGVAVTIVRVRSVASVAYTTVPVVRQDLVQSVTATGTVNAQNTIAVGTQESGTVATIAVDYNSRVKRGQILAKLDPTTFQAALDQARAALAQASAQARSAQATAAGASSGVGNAAATERATAANAQASLATARASQAGIAAAESAVTKARSALQFAQQTVNRDLSLVAAGYVAQSQVDGDRSNLVAAQTTLDSAQASVRQAAAQAAASASLAQAGAAQTDAQNYAVTGATSQAATQSANADATEAAVSIAQAQVRQAQLNLDKTIVRSPVDGTVVARNVAVGTTVAASFQTPTLFSIAQDLGKMEVDVAVGEPDIGNVKAGESVDFNVLAYPAQTFRGIVSQVRINPVTTQNVVTYTTVVLVDNRDGKLLPGMTANASIHVAQAQNALVVPMAALTYQPAQAGQGRRHVARPGPGSTAAAASPWGATTGTASATVGTGSHARLFIDRSGQVARVPVTVRLVSGTQAAVTPDGASLEAGDAAVIGDSASDAPAATRATAPVNPLSGAGGPAGATRGIH